MEFTRDNIKAFEGSWSSGIAFLRFERGIAIPCDNGPLARALMGAFDCSNGNHGIDNALIAGESVVWSFDEMGLLLAGFTPYDNWLSQGHPMLEVGESIRLD